MNLIQTALNLTKDYSAEKINQVFSEPVFILSTPRSGSTLLFENMIQLDGFWSIGAESHAILNQFPHLRFENQNMDSGALSEIHADVKTSELIKRMFLTLVGDYKANRYLQHEQAPGRVCLLEKTPRNALNVPFILSLFPKAKFIFLYREPRQNIASMIEAWLLGQQTGQFVTYPHLEGFNKKWCFLLPKGWKEYKENSIAEIASFQWCATNQVIMDSLSKLDNNHWCKISYLELISNPQQVLESLLRFSLNKPSSITKDLSELPLSRTTVSAPNAEKWRKFEREISDLESQWLPIYQNIQNF